MMVGIPLTGRDYGPVTDMVGLRWFVFEGGADNRVCPHYPRKLKYIALSNTSAVGRVGM